MKPPLFHRLAAAVVALSLASCASSALVYRAEGRRPPSSGPSERDDELEPQPAYYLLLPLTLPFDLVTWPIQYFVLHNRNTD